MAEADTTGTTDAPQWQLTMWTMVAVQVIMTLSFTFLSPVMPLFLPHLGVSTEAEIDLWSGALSAVTSFIAALAAPTWGRMSDRYGRKIMVLRSAFAIGVLTILMALAQNVWHMLGLRILMGAGAGFSAASVVLIASQVPPARLGYALGMLSTGQLVGSLIGPLLGGILVDVTGSYRLPFVIGGSLSLVAFLMCWWLVPERFVKPASDKPKVKLHHAFRAMTRMPGMAALVLVLMFTQFAVQAIQPVISLHVQELLGHVGNIASLAGFAFSATGLAGVLAVPMLGRLADRIGEREVLLIAVFGAALLTLPQAFTTSYTWFVVERFGVGLFIGAIVPTANALIGKLTNPNERGFIFGMTSSVYFLGNSLGPMSGGIVAAGFGLHWVFLMTAILLAGTWALVFGAVPGGRRAH